jgi:hypothetical protein
MDTAKKWTSSHHRSVTWKSQSNVALRIRAAYYSMKLMMFIQYSIRAFVHYFLELKVSHPRVA